MSYSGSGHPYGQYGPPPPGQYGPPPPGPYGPPPPGQWPPPHPPQHPPPYNSGYPSQYPQPYYVPGTMMIPVPVPPMQPPSIPDTGHPTYVTNYIYHGESSGKPPGEEVHVVESSGDYEWRPTTALMANTLSGHPVVGGHEGWDGSPLWVIRAWHNNDLIPGKLSLRHSSATIPYEGKEIPVQNIEVLCAPPGTLRWVPASNGNVPPGAIPGGKTVTGETLYIGRARYQLSVTPGKVHPSHNSCYIGFTGTEVAHKMYDVLCS